MKPTYFTALFLALAVTALALAQGSPATAPSSVTTTGPSSLPGDVNGGDWKSADGVVTQSSMDTPALLIFGDKNWKDYTVELEGQKTEGDEGFLISVRLKDELNQIWFNVGGWGNTRTAFEGQTNGEKTDFGEQQTYGSFAEVQTGKWHKLKVTVQGDKIEGFLDGKSACKATTTGVPATGRIALGTWSTSAKFRGIKVTAPDGKVLWEGTPRVGK